MCSHHKHEFIYFMDHIKSLKTCKHGGILYTNTLKDSCYANGKHVRCDTEKFTESPVVSTGNNFLLMKLRPWSSHLNINLFTR